MVDIKFSVSEVFRQNFRGKKKKRGECCRPHHRPGPAPRPARSGITPATHPAWAGSPAGLLGWAPGLRAGLGRFPGRPTRVAAPTAWRTGPAAGLGRLPGRPTRVVPRPPHRPGPVARPACLPFSFSLFFLRTKMTQRLHFRSPYLRGFFPKIK